MTQSSQISSSHGFADGQNAAAKESKLSGKKMLNMKYIWIRLHLARSHLYPFLFIFKHFNDWSVVWCQDNVDLQHNQKGQTFGSVPHCFCSISLDFWYNGGWIHDIISRSCQPPWFHDFPLLSHHPQKLLWIERPLQVIFMLYSAAFILNDSAEIRFGQSAKRGFFFFCGANTSCLSRSLKVAS